MTHFTDFSKLSIIPLLSKYIIFPVYINISVNQKAFVSPAKMLHTVNCPVSCLIGTITLCKLLQTPFLLGHYIYLHPLTVSYLWWQFLIHYHQCQKKTRLISRTHIFLLILLLSPHLFWKLNKGLFWKKWHGFSSLYLCWEGEG